MNRTIRLLTALLAVVTLLSSCGEQAPTPAQTSTGETTAPPVTETQFTGYADALPASLDFNGRTLRILSSMPYYGKNDTAHMSVLVAEESGDVLNDAIYARDAAVMERFGIKLTEEEMKYHEAKPKLVNNISAGDDLYDIASLTDRDALDIASKGMILPADDLKYADLDRPYWNITLNDAMSIAGKRILAYSDMVLGTYDYTHVLLFNSAMIKQFKLDDPYAVVEDGSWTFDTFEKMALAVTGDLNGDSKMGDDDRYGWAVAPKQVSPLIWVAGGALSIAKDKDGIPSYSMNNEKMLTLLQKAYDMSWGSTYWYQNEQNRIDIIDPPLFASERALFASASFSRLFDAYYRDITFDYGIIPYPKYNEAQETYYTRVEAGSPYFVPVTAGDPDFSGALMEALACESTNTVIPAYYEIALKVKYARDSQSVRMLDMMMQNRVYDLGDTLFNPQIRDGFVLTVFKSKRAIGASDIESNRQAVEAKLKEAVDSISKYYS